MYIHALATAVPTHKFSQNQCWEVALKSEAVSRLNRRSRLMLGELLRNGHGIKTRHFATSSIENIFELSSDQLNSNFRNEAPNLAVSALEKALIKANITAQDLDALVVCTCTGYICPGVSSYVAEKMGIKPNAYLQDLVGLGCGAAIPTMRAVKNILATEPDSIVACIAVEICSAAFFIDDDPGVIVSACLFGDGAAALVCSNKPKSGALYCYEFDTVHKPELRDKLRFEHKNGKLRNMLDKSVPGVVSKAVSELWSRKSTAPVDQVISHGGGKDVIEALIDVIQPHQLEPSITVLEKYGNMSGPSVLFALEEALLENKYATGDDTWLVSFGAGFSAHSCRLKQL